MVGQELNTIPVHKGKGDVLMLAFDRVTREAIQCALRLQKVSEHLIALVMALYSNARSRVRTLAGTSDEFGTGVGVHQGTAPSPLQLLFVVVMQEETRALWELMYTDDLVAIAESEEEAVRKREIDRKSVV